MLCPDCRTPLDPAALACRNGHRFGYEDGVLVLLNEAFGRQLRAFIAVLTAFRAAENKRLLEAAAYEDLPFAEAVRGNLEWRLRCYDLAIIRRLVRGRTDQRILDVGAWNGWLSHRLAQQGYDLTALEHFSDEYDGLRARKWYSTAWRAIQMDLTDLSLLDEQYDVVILNRCVQFFGDPAGYLAHARQRVAPGGLLIITGLPFFRDPSVKVRQVAAIQHSYRERYGVEFFLRPTRGYLDFADKARFQAQGVALRPYPQLWLANLKAMLKPTLPRHYYGVWMEAR